MHPYLCSLITLIVALRWPEISKILFAALIMRLLFLIINNHIFNLPDADMDAKNYEQFAWQLSQNEILHTCNPCYGPGPYFISFLISLPYSLKVFY